MSWVNAVAMCLVVVVVGVDLPPPLRVLTVEMTVATNDTRVCGAGDLRRALMDATVIEAYACRSTRVSNTTRRWVARMVVAARSDEVLRQA